MRKPKNINSNAVARAAGVSQSTVSKVINNSPNLTLETRNRVIRAAQALGYPLFPRNGQRTVAIITHLEDINGYGAEMMAHLSTELLKVNLRFEIIPDTMLELLNERCIDAAVAISWRPALNQEWIRHNIIVPLVRINGLSNNMRKIYSVCHDAIAPLRQQVKHLWQLGHRKIGFFFFNTKEHELSNVARRRDGFLQAMQAMGVEDPEKYCLYDCMPLTISRLASIIKQWRSEGVTALFFSNAYGTGKMVAALQKANVAIPRDLSVIGWELEGVSPYILPSFSTFYPDPAQITPIAVHLLHTLLNDPMNAHDITIPYRWISRRSIDKPACKN